MRRMCRDAIYDVSTNRISINHDFLRPDVFAVDEAQDVDTRRYSACRDVACNVCTDNNASHHVHHL